MTPNLDTRAGRQLDALLKSTNSKGKLLLTVSLRGAAKELHETFQIRKWTNDSGKAFLFVSVPSTADWHAGVKPVTPLSVNLETGEVKEKPATALLTYAAKVALNFAQHGTVPSPGNGEVSVHEDSICGACGIKLTDDVSIQLGYGPDCEKQLFGHVTPRSKTIHSDTKAPAATPEPEAQWEGEVVAQEEATVKPSILSLLLGDEAAA